MGYLHVNVGHLRSFVFILELQGGTKQRRCGGLVTTCMTVVFQIPQ